MKAAGGVVITWSTAAELAELALPGLPRTKRKVNELARASGWQHSVDAAGQPLARPRAGQRGGGLEYHHGVLPPAASAELVRRGLVASTEASVSGPVVAPVAPADHRWAWFNRQSAAVQGEARRRLEAVTAVDRLCADGHTRTAAVAMTAASRAISAATLWNWLKAVQGAGCDQRLPLLAPNRQGGGAEAEIPAEAWRLFLADYLRLEGPPTLMSCYQRLVEEWAAPRGVVLPHHKTFARKVERDVDPLLLAKTRYGAERVRNTVPALIRSVAHFHALEAVNIDGHEWDVRVDFGDGDIGRPMMVMIQDVFSRRVVAWRIGRTESAGLVQLAFKDLFEDWGIPRACYFDNGGAFASKWITGGAPFRFKGRPLQSDPLGLMASLGVEVHFTTPYRGQSKPIERAFGDLERHIGTHPAFAGAYTGRSPAHKPENYGARAVPLDEFMAVVAKGIERHNARGGRRTETARGESFDAVFARSYAASVIPRAGPEQLKLALMTAGKVTADRKSGAVSLFGNTYWSEGQLGLAGRRLVARYNPDDLLSPVHLYDLTSNAFLMEAAIWGPVGFNDVEAAKFKARLDAKVRRHARELEQLQELASASDLAAAYGAPIEGAEPPRPAAIRPVRAQRGGAAVALAEPGRRSVLDRLDLETLAPARAEPGRLRLVE
jgi:putative transposase